MTSLNEATSGDRIGEFEIVDVLGRGGFGVVYLARETSLDRLVALKVSPDAGREGRNLAQLEHENIVQVFSETVDVLRQQRLMCMQYVPGVTLGCLITLLGEHGKGVRSGAGIIALLDQQKHRHARFDPTALRDREVLQRGDFVEAVCWLGSRMAEALGHAHERNILHLDIKPNNILVNQYGRPYLSDFNLSFQSVDLNTAQPHMFGGTLPYMSPEHLELFLAGGEDAHERLDARADIYSLGIVLFELAAGRLPFETASEGHLRQGVQAMIKERREEVRDRLRGLDSGEVTLDRIIQRCLAPAPEERYARASDLQQELEGCRELHRARIAMPSPGWLLRHVLRRPWFWLIFFGLLPHLIGTVVQISYNETRIVHELSAQQQELFMRLVIGYNPIVYPVCLAWLASYVLPAYRVWRRWQSDPFRGEADIEAARRQTIRVPAKSVLIGSVGWLGGGIFFPTVLHWRAGPLPADAWVHFWISFLLAGSISVTYAFIFAQYVILRAMYLEMWLTPRRFHSRCATELAPIEPQMRIFQWLAGAIPFMGAVLMVSAGPDEFTPSGYGAFRILVTLLILSGMLGARLAAGIGRQVSSMIGNLTAGAA